MSDLFHREVPDDFILAVVKVMVTADWHTYQVLTKRSGRMRDLLQTKLRKVAHEPHIWWGVSVEDLRHGLPRVEELRSTPARVRFLSVEPLLEDLGRIDLNGIHWVIAGGESGAGARPLRPEWVRSLRDQCHRCGVPFFFKQWGGVRKSQSGRRLDGRFHDARPPLADREIPPPAQRKRLIAELEESRVLCHG
jgi:protein gp37